MVPHIRTVMMVLHINIRTSLTCVGVLFGRHALFARLRSLRTPAKRGNIKTCTGTVLNLRNFISAVLVFGLIPSSSFATVCRMTCQTASLRFPAVANSQSVPSGTTTAPHHRRHSLAHSKCKADISRAGTEKVAIAGHDCCGGKGATSSLSCTSSFRSLFLESANPKPTVNPLATTTVRTSSIPTSVSLAVRRALPTALRDHSPTSLSLRI